MNLLPLAPAHIPLVIEWLQRKENYQWFDFGGGRQILDAVTLKIMIHRRSNFIRLYTTDEDNDRSIGVVAFANLADNFKTAELWYVLGERHFGRQGYTTRAVSKLLQIGFGELGLECIFAWAVQVNRPSIRVIEKNGFRPIGRLRHSHRLDEVSVDRLLFDLLASEHRSVEDRVLISSKEGTP